MKEWCKEYNMNGYTFEELCKEFGYDEEKIINELKSLFVQGVRRPGTREREAFEILFMNDDEFKEGGWYSKGLKKE
jgi:hypothetical protein